MERIVLAYSGGLDTSVAIPWLAERYGAEIIAVTMDLGQGKELEDVRDRALATGAVRAHVLDVREEFARDYVLRALKAGAIYEDRYPMGTALGRPLIARKLVEIAAIEQATAIAHGCTGKGNDQVRLDVAARALNPALTVVAPARDWGMTRPQEIEYARRHGAPGVGRIDMVENRLVGIKSREIYEAPAAVVLHAAHKELQRMVTTRDGDRFSSLVSLHYADVVYNGLWFTPLREALDAYVDKV